MTAEIDLKRRLYPEADRVISEQFKSAIAVHQAAAAAAREKAEVDHFVSNLGGAFAVVPVIAGALAVDGITIRGAMEKIEAALRGRVLITSAIAQAIYAILIKLVKVPTSTASFVAAELNLYARSYPEADRVIAEQFKSTIKLQKAAAEAAREKAEVDHFVETLGGILAVVPVIGNALIGSGVTIRGAMEKIEAALRGRVLLTSSIVQAIYAILIKLITAPAFSTPGR